MSKRSEDLFEREWFGNNRHLCDVLEDMRKCDKTKNYSMLRGLIEEAQVMGSRMESALSDQKDIVKLQEKVSEVRREYKKLKAEYKALEKKKDAIDPERAEKLQK